MSGDKIKLVKRTLKHMLEFLGPQDRLCLIQFDCKCYRLTRLMNVTPENLPKFRIAIHSIQARGGTDIENGMHMAFSVLRHRKYKNPVCAIFLLSG
jgi:Mg-chelatase subunit ChlD